MKKTNPDKFLIRDSFLITVLTFFIYWLLHIIVINIHFLDAGNESKEDADVNDILYANFGERKMLDTTKRVSYQQQNKDIFLVNVGNAKREQIATMIDNIAQRQPKVIGLDISFTTAREDFNPHLQKILKKYENKIVLGGFFTYNDKSELSEFIVSDSAYRHSILTGHTNFVTSFSQGVVRRFTPFVEFKGDTIPSFAAAVVKIDSMEAYEKLKKREKIARSKNKNSHENSDPVEIINYQYAMNNFVVLGQNEVLKNDFQLSLKDKIVLFGLINQDSSSHTLEDYHFTPLNQDKNIADMSGVGIHANIISMILSGKYINHFPVWLTYVLSFLLCFIHIIWFLKISVKNHIWFHLLFKIIQFFSLVVIVLISLFTYKFFNLRIETSIIAVPIALSADALIFGGAIAKWLHQKYKTISYFIRGTAQH
jgi:CHASE2 domain-containing sensor protein